MRKSSFELLGIEGTFEGFTADDHWNGWECPYFTRSEGLKLVEAWNAVSDEASERGPARHDNDRFEFTLGGEVDTFGAESIEGVHRRSKALPHRSVWLVLGGVRITRVRRGATWTITNALPNK